MSPSLTNRGQSSRNPLRRGSRFFIDSDTNQRFERAALAHGWIEQRTADEIQAGRQFPNARAWIDWTMRNKGELSGADLSVRWRDGRNDAWLRYTQTREYHMTGGSEMVERNGVWGCEPIRLDHRVTSVPDVFVQDMYRARALERSIAGSSATMNEVRAWNLSQAIRQPLSGRTSSDGASTNASAALDSLSYIRADRTSQRQVAGPARH